MSPRYFIKNATFTIRVNVRYPFMRITSVSYMAPHIQDKIQNLDVYWEPLDPEEVKERDIEYLNWDPPIRRRLCRVFYRWTPAERGMLKRFVDHDLMTFAGFETVEIRVILKPQGRPPKDHVPVTESGSKPTVSEDICAKMIPVYKQLVRELKSGFGAAELNKNPPPDQGLRFQPRKHRAKTAKKS